MLFILAKFDVRLGNRIVWTSEKTNLSNLPGIEFKMIPSGLHDRKRETIYFVSGIQHGLACYEARVVGDARDPTKTLIYSLGALVPQDEDFPWGVEPYLRLELSKFLDSGHALDNDPAALGLLASPPRSDPRSHPVLATSRFLRVYGSLVFELWKAGLSRSRTILASVPGQSIRNMSQFTYICAQLSSIPSDVLEELPASRRLDVRVVYNVGVSDLPRLQSAESFWATTTDGLLLSPSRDACDLYADRTSVHDFSGGGPERKVLPTWRDRHRFSVLIDALQLSDIPTTSGFVDSLIDSTSNGLIWWASAGESIMIDRDETAPLLQAPTSPLLFDSDHAFHADFETGSGVVALIGQFQQYTRQLVTVFSKIASISETVIVVRASDIAAMGLDPVARSDRDFLQRFSLTWWDRPVVFSGGCCAGMFCA